LGAWCITPIYPGRGGSTKLRKFLNGSTVTSSRSWASIIRIEKFSWA